MRLYLLRHEQDERVRELVLERLKANGWLDDQRFAAQWVENRVAFRPRGKKALALELKQRGIQATDIDQAVQELDEEELAYQAAQKVLGRYKNLDQNTFRRKLYDLLVRRGFSYEVVLPTIHRCWQENRQNTGIEQEDIQNG